MTHKTSGDFETRARVDIKRRGAAVYFECPAFMPLILRYRVRGGPLDTWLYTDRDCPANLRASIEAGDEFHGWNVAFEAGGLDWLRVNWDWPAYDPAQLVDTAAAAAALGLPRSLGEAAKVMGLSEQKDPEGEALINFFSKPRRDGTFNDPAEHPEKFQKYIAYCGQDVKTEEAMSDRVPALSARERRVWLYDFRKNRHGIRIDVSAAIGASKIAKDEIARLNAEMHKITNGAVATCSQIAKLKAWCEACGVKLKSTDKANVSTALADPALSADVRHALLIRQEAGKTSVAKLDAMLRRASADGRVRGTSIYHGASTGRNTSTGVNFSNMPRPSRHWEDTKLDKAALFRAFKSGDATSLPKWQGGALQLISDATRSFVLAAPGKFIVQADYASIEGVFAAWIAGETWKVEAYRELMLNPSLPDIYRRMAAKLLGTTTDEITKKHPMRQALGKTPELAFQYGGGVAAMLMFATLYGVDLDSLYAAISASASEENQLKAARRHARCVKRGQHKTDAMSRDAWLGCELAKLGWRADNPATTASWKIYEDAMRMAVLEPGTQHSVLGVSYRVAHGFLWCRLPSGRPLAYATPRLRECSWVRQKNEDGSLDDPEAMDTADAYALVRQGLAVIEGPAKSRVTACGVDSVTRQWRRYAITGGLALENNTQGGCRDILVDGLIRLEDAGWELVSDVYDEAIAEASLDRCNLDEFVRLFCQLERCYAGLPISAEAWFAKRYRK